MQCRGQLYSYAHLLKISSPPLVIWPCYDIHLLVHLNRGPVLQQAIVLSFTQISQNSTKTQCSGQHCATLERTWATMRPCMMRKPHRLSEKAASRMKAMKNTIALQPPCTHDECEQVTTLGLDR
jgi:hypothetical protein